MKEVEFEFANRIDSDEAAQNEPPHWLYTVCPLVFEISIWLYNYSLDKTFFKDFADQCTFVVHFIFALLGLKVLITISVI